MAGLDQIKEAVRNMMEELFDGVEERDLIMRSLAEHMGVTDVSVIVDVAFESGFRNATEYPLLHFLVTVAQNVPEALVDNIKASLNDLNTVLAVGGFPSFGAFTYYPRLNQIFLSYRLPVNPTSPEEEIPNIRYYLGVLVQELDMFVDFIMFLCDEDGNLPDLDTYLDYLNEVQDPDDLEERIRILEDKIQAMDEKWSEDGKTEE